MNILEELYYGNINPNEKQLDRNSQYAKFTKIIAANEVKLTEYLASLPDSKEEQHLFFQLMNAQSEVCQFNQLDRFIEGFQLGAKFTLDMFVLPQQSVVRDIV